MTKDSTTHPIIKDPVFNKPKPKHQSPCHCSGNEITRSEGEIVITVTRNTFFLLVPLPYCIWGALYVQSNFGAVLKDYLPPGITVTSVNNEDGSITFSYTDGLETDTISISSPSASIISYLENVASLNTNMMRSNFMTFNCNSGNPNPFYSNDQIDNLQSGGLYMQKTSAGSLGGGYKSTQVIIPNSRKQINNSVPNIIELYLRNEEVKPDTVWIHQFAYASDAIPGRLPSPIQFTFTVFISERINMNHQ